jgi:protein-S-isoprenylcysteine O-methyltransferase Ste14
MRLDYYHLALDLWTILGIIWLLGMLTTKRTVRTQPLGPRTFQIGLSFLAFYLAFTHTFQTGWLGLRLFPSSDSTSASGLALTFLGIAFAVWARLLLGRNWSSNVTLKQDHTLIRRGPYKIVRHPIYTGFLLAMLGTAMIVGEIRGLVAVGLLFLALWLKLNMEERFMIEQFGPEYRQYQSEVKGLIPYVF